MSRTYAKALTKKELIEKFNITDVTTDGHVFRNGEEIQPRRVGNYLSITMSDKTYGKIPCVRTTKVARVDGTVTDCTFNTYRYRNVTYGIHRLVYVWNVGDQPAGYVVDHIDNNRDNNNVDNLQLLTPHDNIIKERKHVKKVPMPKKTVYTVGYIEGKLNAFRERYEAAKAAGDADEAHKLRSSLSMWSAKMRLLNENYGLFRDRAHAIEDAEAAKTVKRELTDKIKSCRAQADRYKELADTCTSKKQREAYLESWHETLDELKGLQAAKKSLSNYVQSA